MATLTIPNTFVAGTSVVAADMNSNFSAVATLVNTTKLDHDNLNFPYQDVTIGPFHVGANLNNSSSTIVWKPVISTGTMTPLQLSVSAQTMGGGTSLTVNVYRNPASIASPASGESILNSAVTYAVGVKNTLVASTNFKAASSSDFASGDVMLIEVTETSGGANVSDISITLQAALKHRATP